MLFQMESFGKVKYSLFSKEWGFDSPISDTFSINCKTILSEYRSIKVNDIIEVKFRVEPFLMDKDSNPSGFGWLDRDRVNKKHCFHISVPPTFPERFEFILNRDIKPYFYIRCEKEKNESAIVKTFSMESEIVLEDYL